MQRLEELLAGVLRKVAARNEDVKAVIVLDLRVPRNLAAPAPVLVLVYARFPEPEADG